MRYHSITLTVFISCSLLLWSSCTGENTARQDDTPLRIGIAWRGDSTAITKTNGVDIIEAVERTDKPFFIGLQYHPEVAVTKHSNGAADASRFMSYEDALCYFRALVNQGK